MNQVMKMEIIYNYELQTWVAGGIILSCSHPVDMRQVSRAGVGNIACCNGWKYQGLTVDEALRRKGG